MVKPGDGYKDIPIGGLILEAGNAKSYKTGGWRTKKPILDKERCINCHLCWAFCPDMSILSEDGVVSDQIDYDHCKGCGICAHECPVNAIEMVKE